MTRLEEAKSRLERVLARFDVISTRMQSLRDESQALRSEFQFVQQSEQLLRVAAADALAEVDQAIAILAEQASTQGTNVDPVAPLKLSDGDELDQAAVEPFAPPLHNAPGLELRAGTTPGRLDLGVEDLEPSAPAKAAEIAEPVVAFDSDQPPGERRDHDHDQNQEIDLDAVEQDESSANENRRNIVSNGGSWSILDD